MKYAVYTCNVGGYDLMMPPIAKDPLVDYIYFTDQDSAPAGWQHKKILVDKSECLTARKIKILSNIFMGNYDLTIWIDASFSPRLRNIRKWAVDALGDNLIACYSHNVGYKDCVGRTCIYEEAKECKVLKLDDIRLINFQIAEYRRQKFPEKFGLFSTGIIVRRKHPKIEEFEKIWWQQVATYSKRDQLSQMYAIWKCKLSISRIVEGGVNIYMSKFFEKHKHIKRRKKK